jgi:hypothetical protein
VDRQRALYKTGKLSAERIERLEGLGFGWDPSKAAWEEGYSQLVAYKEANGDVLVPVIHETEDGFRLGSWVNNQRRAYNRGKLSTDRIERLEDLGFVWVLRKRSVGT